MRTERADVRGLVAAGGSKGKELYTEFCKQFHRLSALGLCGKLTLGKIEGCGFPALCHYNDILFNARFPGNMSKK